jgi:hypothetical protein
LLLLDQRCYWMMMIVESFLCKMKFMRFCRIKFS